MDQTSGECSLC